MGVLAWASFFISRAAVPARVTMASVSFLTITNFIGGQLKTLPSLGSGEVWLLQFMQTSQIFTFYSLLEYIICNYLYRVKRRIIDIKEIAKKRKMVKMSL